jgi:tRNA modification GTPase
VSPASLAPIVAIATASGRGAVGIIRLSGPSLGALVETLCGRSLRAREATYLKFKATDGSVIDQGLALHFPAPHSYTGEEVLELQAHGGPVVLQLLLARCLEAGAALGLRLARPGEFTERAFLNDKIDLAQAEAIADLIDASTEAAARSASRSLSGEFSAQVHALRDGLVHLRMLVEATLDFPEEEIDFLDKANARGQLLTLQRALVNLFGRARQGALLRDGIKVVIAGQPNAGKSSLLNALAGAELAIVTPVAGTTRDVVTQTIQIEGVPLHVVDTAGLRDSADLVEQIGIARAWGQIESADAVLFLHDLSRQHAPEYRADDDAIAAEIAQKVSRSVPIINVWNKLDSVAASSVQLAPGTVPASAQTATDRTLYLSAKTGVGLAGLRQRLLAVGGWQAHPDGVFIARGRHLDALQRAQAHVDAATQQLTAPGPALDLLAEDLRCAQLCLNEITGEFTADDLLGVIFSKFCIGK